MALPRLVRSAIIFLAILLRLEAGLKTDDANSLRSRLADLPIPDTTVTAIDYDAAQAAYQVTLVLQHPPATDQVTIWVSLPARKWNGRFIGTGGSGFLGGAPNRLQYWVGLGYAAAATDTGHAGEDPRFVLDSQGGLNWQQVRNLAYLAIHDMTVVGKAVTRACYGRAPSKAYFVGGSTGGRQALTEAQRYPTDYDGILANYPAIYWHQFLLADLWPQVVMQESKHVVPLAKLSAATAAAVSACDAEDGTGDGVLDDPYRCHYDPQALIGTLVNGDRFTADDAAVIRKIWTGPHGHDGHSLWPGPTLDTDLTALAASDNATHTGQPFPVSVGWIGCFLRRDPNWDWRSLDTFQLELLFQQSSEEFDAAFGLSPDLSGIRAAGGKILIVHGLADELVPAQGTINYFRRIQRAMGSEGTQDCVRLFLVPGANHALRGPGPVPTQAGSFAALTRWVENREAPEELAGTLLDTSGRVLRTKVFHAIR